MRGSLAPVKRSSSHNAKKKRVDSGVTAPNILTPNRKSIHHSVVEKSREFDIHYTIDRADKLSSGSIHHGWIRSRIEGCKSTDSAADSGTRIGPQSSEIT